MINNLQSVLMMPGRLPTRQSALPSPDSIVAFLRSLRRYLDAKDAAKILGCHRESLYILIAEQGLPAEKRGRRWRIDPIKFAAWLEARGFASSTTAQEPSRQETGDTKQETEAGPARPS
jgi:excisionase family DNA binding protein